MNSRSFGMVLAFACALAFLAPVAGPRAGVPAAQAAGQPLIVNGDFESATNSISLRVQPKKMAWYESRKDGPGGPKLLMLSTKPVKGNATKKAIIKASAKRNTYLTQAFTAPQSGRFSLKWDILVRQIQKPANRSAFQMIGNAQGKSPNGSGPQRFVFLAFENGTAPGTMNLIAMDGQTAQTAGQRTVIASGLSLQKWYTVRVDVDVAGKSYAVTVPGVTATPVTVKAFNGGGKGAPASLTHLSFASWNDGPGTFLIDNVGQP